MTVKKRYSRDADFYVGYKSMPSTLRYFYFSIAMLVIIGFPLAAFSVASQQKTAGHGIWNTAEPLTLSGYLEAAPYPVLHIASGDGEITESVLLIQPGKHTATELATPFSGQQVSITGSLISRDGWKMLEVPGPDAVIADSAESPVAPPESVALEKVTMVGEIVGSKCFLGVMKPGTGITHKACAELCLLGGVPPMFVASNPQGQRFGYLVVSADNQSLSTDLAKSAAEPAQVSGQLQQRGSLLYLLLDTDGLVML